MKTVYPLQTKFAGGITTKTSLYMQDWYASMAGQIYFSVSNVIIFKQHSRLMPVAEDVFIL